MYVITRVGEEEKKKKKVCEIECSKGIGCDGREVKISVQIWLFLYWQIPDGIWWALERVLIQPE